ncbi:MAG: hypothetical protein Q8R02_15835 [Hyphomonadaceae bacterium]|nr:hypothetical protein [Hyphomonadaceae bacterium]
MSANQKSQGAFSLRIVLGLVVVGVVSFAAFIVLSAFADDLRSPEESGEHAESKSAIGFAGLVDLLQKEGRHVRTSRGSLYEAGGHEEFAVMTPPLGATVDWDKVYGSPGPILIVMPKWNVRPDQNHRGWVISQGLGRDEIIENALEQISPEATVKHFRGVRDLALKNEEAVGSFVQTGPIDSLQVIDSDAFTPILSDIEGRTVLGVYAGGDDGEYDDDYSSIYILSDPDLLNTQGLASPLTARAGLEVIRLVVSEDTPIAFDMTLHGIERSRNFLRLMFVPPFLPAVLCLAFAGGLMAVYAVAGNVKQKSGREIALGKAMLVENTALLVSLTGRDKNIGQRYVAMTRTLAATAAGAPSGSTETQQTTMLDAVAQVQKSEASFSRLATDVAIASSRAQLLRAINRLYHWRQEIGREHRRR